MQRTKTTRYQQKCDAHALFRYSTRVEHPGCHSKEGETMQLLTENATVAQSKTQDEAMEQTYGAYTRLTHPRTF